MRVNYWHALAIVGLLLWAPIGNSQVPVPLLPPPSSLVPFSGSEYFRFILHLQGLKPLATITEADELPAETLIVILGTGNNRQDFLDLTGPELRQFMAWGGAVLLADNNSNEGFSWRDTFGVELTGERLSSPKELGYLEQPGRPYVQPRLGDAALQVFGPESPHLIFSGADPTGPKGIATDSPSSMYLRRVARPGLSATRLAGYAEKTKRDDGKFFDSRNCDFAVSFQANGTSGRMLVLANQRVFCNGMLGLRPREDRKGVETDNGNLEFSKRAIEWLQKGSPKPRTRCLFVENGSIVDRFAVTVAKPPKPKMPNLPPDMLADLLLNHADSILEEREQAIDFDRMVTNALGLPVILKYFIYLASVVLFFLGFTRLIRSYWKPASGGSISERTLERLMPKGGILRQRQTSQFESGNLYEAARLRVRDRFDRMGVQPLASGEMPPVLIGDDSNAAQMISVQVRNLWEIGYGKSLIFVSPGDWDALNRDLERLMKQASRGIWTFGQEIVS